MSTTDTPTSTPIPPRSCDEMTTRHTQILEPLDTFARRHIGPREGEVAPMLETVGYPSLEALMDATVPSGIRLDAPMTLSAPADRLRGEAELLAELRTMAQQNRVFRSCIGMGYHGTVTPGVILRNILENPGWYTQYTPYQSEISQGRLEALLHFQTVVSDLTGLPIAGASLLDEGTAAAEAMAMCVSATRRQKFFVASDCHPQTIEVVRTRADSIGIELVVGVPSIDAIDDSFAGVLVQYPTTDGRVECYEQLAKTAHGCGALLVAAADPLALVLLRPPGEWGADIAVGSMQRFGVPMGFGGPHAAYMAVTTKLTRKMPGRIIGVSKDAMGKPAYRMAIQTREQHIKRERATSNICTAQALLAIMAGMYGVYHGADGLRAIAGRVRLWTEALRLGLVGLGHEIAHELVFDTLRVKPVGRDAGMVLQAAQEREINLRDFGDGTVGVTLDETCDAGLLQDLLLAFGAEGSCTTRAGKPAPLVNELLVRAQADVPSAFARTSEFLTHPIFHSCQSETEMLRHIFRLQGRDLSLVHATIPLGSCTMKLNGTSEMLPVTWPEFADMHPFAPATQTEGYRELFIQLETWLAEITGFAAVSLQPNAGSQGEFAGLMVIRAHHEARGEGGRDVCLIPASAHGTNPASAITAGMKVVVVKCDERGNIDVGDLREKAEKHRERLAALMVTYPSTHGVFEKAITEVCDIIHEFGGQVYMDGANMNAQVGLTNPGRIGADVCHLNLHKTFCIPHGGGGPGVGPIGVAAHLAPYLPGHSVVRPFDDSPKSRESSKAQGSESLGLGKSAIGAISAAPWGSASILPISWVYIALMGAEGLTQATEMAILNANYMAARLRGHYDILYTGEMGAVAHEFIIDCRQFEKSAGVKVEDIAKRLMDYSFHAPTMSFPVPGTLMIEPTESEPLRELDRLCDALIAIRREISEIEEGTLDREDNPLKNSPHTAEMIAVDGWTHPYSRDRAAYPLAGLRENKFWPACARVDNPFGDRHLVCSCPSMEEFAS